MRLPSTRPPFYGYVMAVLATAAVLLVRSLILAPIFDYRASKLSYLLAVTVSSWYGGRKAGLFATLLSGMLIACFMAPIGSLYVEDTSDRLQLFVFFIVAATISYLCGLLHTARQRIETAYRQLEGEIVQRQESEAAQKRMADLLRDADQKKNEFLAMLAHELRNPLAPLRNALQIMRLADGNREVANNARNIMERQLGQMVRLVDDLLDVNRISRGKLELRKERVELAAVLRDAVEISRPAIEAASHELTVNLPAPPLFLHGDPARLAQVFSNLLNNAAKYTPQGGRIGLTVERQGSKAAITVRDNGTGIPHDLLGNIFDMFAQADRRLERTTGGLGIGLALVKRLVEMHEGCIEIHSDGPGKGSEFVVCLPVLMELPSRGVERADGAEQLVRPPPCRILAVDDNKDAMDTLALLLQMMGCDVHTAQDGLDALEAAEAFRPDVVLMDIGMPQLDGYEAARRIRKNEWGKDMVLIAMTGYGQQEDRRHSREAGFDYHLIKPVDAADLMKLLAQLHPMPVSSR